MNWEPLLRSLRALFVFSLCTAKETWNRIRFIVITILVSLLVLLFAFRFAAVAAAVPNDVPGTVAVWDAAADGALTGLAFSAVPILLPVVPIALAYDVMRRERHSGVLETAASRSAPPWVYFLGVFLGMFLAIAVPWILLDVVCVFVVWGVTGTAVSGGLIAAFVAGTLLLIALYLAFVLLLSSFLTAGQALGIAFLAWVLFNALRATALTLAGQFLLIVPVDLPQTFQTGWADLLSFTGLYQGILAFGVPAGLKFVIDPGLFHLGDMLARIAVAMAGVPLLLFLLQAYLVSASRNPMGR